MINFRISILGVSVELSIWKSSKLKKAPRH